MADFASPATPVRLGTYSNSALVSVHALAFHAPKLALTDGATILLLDLTQPASPVLLASATAAAYAHDLAWCGNNLVVADGPAGVSVLDGSSLARLGGYNTAGRALGVECSGAYAFIADGQNGWLTLDLTNPASPAPGAANTERPVVNMALKGSLLFTASGHGAVQAKDVGKPPLTPLSAVQYESLTKALRMVATPAGVLISEDDAGLALLSTGGADADGDGLPDWWEQALVDADANDGITSILDSARQRFRPGRRQQPRRMAGRVGRRGCQLPVRGGIHRSRAGWLCGTLEQHLGPHLHPAPVGGPDEWLHGCRRGYRPPIRSTATPHPSPPRAPTSWSP